MQSYVIKSVGELAAAKWDQLEHPFYSSGDWLRARSQTIKADERFLVVSDQNSPLAGVPAYLVNRSSHPGFYPPGVLSISDLENPELDSLPGAAQALPELRDELQRRGDEWAPSLVMSAPGRLGGISYKAGLTDDIRRAALAATIDAIEKQAQADSARAICWLYFPEQEYPPLEELLNERDYLSVAVDAECYLPIRWQDFQEYLSMFRAKDRWKIKFEMAALEDAGVEVDLHGGEVLGPDLAPLELQWREKYGRKPSIEEILNDYEMLRTVVGPSLRVFVARLGNRPIGFTTFLDHGDVWYARFCGFDYTVGNLFLYFNLFFYRPMQFFIDRNVRHVHYALKAYQAKCSRGCRLRNVMAHVKPPEGWSRLEPLLKIIDEAQRFRFATIEKRYAPARMVGRST